MNMQGLHYDLDSLFPENPDFLQEEELCMKDREQLIRLYPQDIRRIAVMVGEYLDRYEYEGSPMFYEYPDTVTVYWMVDDLYNNIISDEDIEDSERVRNLVQVMMCDEMYIRRRRHERFCRRF